MRFDCLKLGRAVPAIALLGVLSTAVASAQTTKTYKPSPVDLYDLDHHKAYTWRIDNVNLTGKTITSASLFIDNIRNWDTNPNMLFIHMLDTAKGSGVRSFTDDPSNSVPVPVSEIIDDFVNPRYHGNAAWLVAAGTADTFLDSRAFTTSAVDYLFTFNASQLQTLQSYIMNGQNVAFGFDPDCHFWNDGIKFKMTYINTPPPPSTPEPGTLALLGTGMAPVIRSLRRRRRA
jgi:hypothetical protein